MSTTLVHRGELFQGFLASIPITICFSSSNESIIVVDERGERPSLFEPLKTGFLLNLLLYPLMTVQRRLQCQSTDTFMLPARYRNYRHAFRDMYKVEGWRSFYRGFPLHMIGFVGFLLIVKSAKLSLENSTMSGNVSKEVF